jgi:hypothetical protein
MIISVSRRTDIPAFYGEWLAARLRAGYCLVRNPYNPAQVRRVSLLPEDVDGIVLWTKNAAPLLPLLSELDAYQYYFQYTVTPYHTDVETGLPDKAGTVIPAFLRIADAIGPNRVIWRYDPILITPRYTREYHVRAFEKLCGMFAGSTEKCVISFAVPYKSAAKSLAALGHAEQSAEDKTRLVSALLEIADAHGIALCACCEAPALYALGVRPISCVDASMFGVSAARDKYQREGCNCQHRHRRVQLLPERLPLLLRQPQRNSSPHPQRGA